MKTGTKIAIGFTAGFVSGVGFSIVVLSILLLLVGLETSV